MFGWFDAKEAVARGKEIAQSVSGFLAHAETGGAAGKEAKVRAKFDRLVERSALAIRGQRFNLYQKAKFGNTLKWELREAGYPDDFVDEFVTLLLLRIR